MKKFGALVVGGMLAIAGCSGSNGAQGPQGPKGDKGDTGSIGPTAMNGATGQKLKLVIEGVVTANNTATLTFVVYPAANVCPGGTCSDNLSVLDQSPQNKGQKTFYAQEYNANTKTFDTAKSFSFGSIHFKEITSDGNGARYTAIKANPPFVVENSTSAFVYGYIATAGAVPVNQDSSRHYSLPSSVSSAAKVYPAGSTINYTSNAIVSGCERCHGAPYSKHGYRQATVAGLPDFVSCKVCHTDQRVGADGDWYIAADDPQILASTDATFANSTTLAGRYAYTANIMNDVHNSHAFEFNYPQSMANCVTCHKGKIANVTADKFFKPSVCKSCHPYYAKAGVEGERAPAMHQIWQDANLLVAHAGVDPWYAVTDGDSDHNLGTCNVCHYAGNTSMLGIKTFAQIHKGYDEQIYKDATLARFDATYVATVLSASYDAAAYLATVTFSVSGVSTTANAVNPTVVASLYGWDSKDFVVSGHNNAADGKRALEWTGGASGNNSRLVVTQGADAATWVATFDLSSFSNLIGTGKMVQRMEVGILPAVGMDPTQVISTTTGNLAAGVTGKTQTIDLTKTASDARIAASAVYGKTIVDAAKCNKCHDELGISFHGPNYGSAGVIACRLCHTINNAASHLEVQGRSIDSFVHALHAMENMDTKNLNLNDKVTAFRYKEHVDGLYPNFAGALNCESCHAAGTYDPPNQQKSLPGFISAIAAPAGRTGMPAPGALPQEITGPGARACGACHRAFALNENDGNGLATFVAHTNKFSTYVTSTMDPAYSVTSTAAYVEYLVGGAGTAPATIGAQIEQCGDCHATAGTDHQTLFNIWANGIK